MGHDGLPVAELEGVRVVREDRPLERGYVLGEEGTILWDYHAKRVSWHAGGRGWEEFEYPAYERNDRFIAEMRHLIACVRREELPKVDALAGSRVLRLALGAKESALTGNVSWVGS